MEINGTFIGATVSIRKAGDIIPQIIRVDKPSPNAAQHIKDQDFWPRHCPSCNEPITVEVHAEKKGEPSTEHLMCNNPRCKGKLGIKLSKGLSALRIKGIGDATCELLVQSGVENIFDVFDASKFNTQSLCRNGHFKPGRNLEKVLQAPKSIKSIDLDKVVLSLQFEGLGDTGSKAVADFLFENIKTYDGMGLDREVIAPFANHSSWQMNSVKQLMIVLKAAGITVNQPKKVQAGAIVFEMTGGPDGAGYKTKEEFVNFVMRHGYTHGKIKAASMLVTDSYSATTSKMQEAKKKGIEIITYEDLLERIENGSK